MESTNCPLCNSNDFDVARIDSMASLTRAGSVSFPVVTVVCRHCGHVYSNPRMSSGELQEYYRHYYREDYGDAEPSTEMADLYRMDAAWIEELLGEGGGRRALEIGSYTGHLLSLLSNQGWATVGVEPTTTAAEIARDRFGLDVHNCMFDQVPPPESDSEKFDLVVMGAVLEHLVDPSHVLDRVHGFLKENGYLFVRVPNVARLILDSVGDIFTLQHPNMYSNESLRDFYRKSGFVEQSHTTHEGWDRHIISMARRTERPAFSSTSFENRVLAKSIREHIADYGNRLDAIRSAVDQRLREFWDPEPRPIVIFGAGNHTEFLFRYTNIRRARILALSDSNPDKWGEEVFGFEVVPPSEIDVRLPEAVVISSRAFQEDIHKSLAEQIDTQLVRLYDITAASLRG